MNAFFCRIQALLKARVVEIRQVGVERSVRRQAKRELGLDMNTTIRQVVWRKTISSGSGSKADKQMRDKHWWVQGHIRVQPYPREGVHRAIYIDDHPP